jgi:hypothetical protein
MAHYGEHETQKDSSEAAKPMQLPARLQVAEVLESRYSSESERSQIFKDQWFVPELNRPMSWDDRRGGVDVVRVAGGEVVRLLSSGMQSVPKPGWVIILTSGSEEGGYSWTLYGLPAAGSSARELPLE